MTDRPWLKAPLWAASFVPAWSRINDDRHYLSQVVLGWWLAWLSVCSVDETQRQRQCWQLAPLLGPETMGAGLHVSY
jgi:membrane-associated phospholipid phosphatase